MSGTVRRARRAGLWLSLATGLGLLGTIFLWQMAAAPARLLAAEGVEVEGTVLGGEVEGSRGDDRRIVEVAFPIEGGGESTVRAVVDEETFNTLRVGDPMPVRYAASDPSVAEVQPGQLAAQARIVGWIAVAMGLAFAISLVVAWRESRARRLATAGA